MKLNVTALVLLLLSPALLLLSPAESLASEPETMPNTVTGSDAVPAATEISEEIVVTARKREENVQHVPVAVTVVNGEALEERAAVDISEIQADVPNLSIFQARNQSSTLTAFLRGVGQAEPLWGVDPGVGVYLDDVYMARAQGALLDVFDVERVEVLRGPQGTLYGKNTIGGAVRYISRPLTDTFNGSLNVTAGEHGTLDVRAAAGGALVPGKLRARVAFASLTRDGYGRNLHTGREVENKDTTAFRLSLDWLPAENLAIQLRFDHTDDKSAPKGLTRLEANPLCPAFNGGPCEPLSNLFDTEAGMEPLNGTESSGSSMLVEWNFSETWTFRAITAARESETFNFMDFDTTPAHFVEAGGSYDDKQFSQEFQLNYDGGERLNGVLGLYYFSGTAGGEILETIFGTSFTTLNGEVHTDSLAVFGDGSYAANERLTFHFGLRVTEEDKRGISRNGIYSDRTFSERVGLRSDFDKNVTFSSVAPKLGLDYAFRDGVMGYVTLSRGFKGGGFNVRAQEQAFPESADPYDDEVLTMAELGVKSTLANRSLLLNAAVFGDSTLTNEGGPDPRDPTQPLEPLVQPAYDLFHAGMTWTSFDGKWNVSVNGKNLGNEEYLLSGYNVPILGVIVGNYAAPRTVTLTLGRRF